MGAINAVFQRILCSTWCTDRVGRARGLSEQDDKQCTLRTKKWDARSRTTMARHSHVAAEKTRQKPWRTTVNAQRMGNACPKIITDGLASMVRAKKECTGSEDASGRARV